MDRFDIKHIVALRWKEDLVKARSEIKRMLDENETT